MQVLNVAVEKHLLPAINNHAYNISDKLQSLFLYKILEIVFLSFLSNLFIIISIGVCLFNSNNVPELKEIFPDTKFD